MSLISLPKKISVFEFERNHKSLKFGKIGKYLSKKWFLLLKHQQSWRAKEYAGGCWPSHYFVTKEKDVQPT